MHRLSFYSQEKRQGISSICPRLHQHTGYEHEQMSKFPPVRWVSIHLYFLVCACFITFCYENLLGFVLQFWLLVFS